MSFEMLFTATSAERSPSLSSHAVTPESSSSCFVRTLISRTSESKLITGGVLSVKKCYCTNVSAKSPASTTVKTASAIFVTFNISPPLF